MTPLEYQKYDRLPMSYWQERISVIQDDLAVSSQHPLGKLDAEALLGYLSWLKKKLARNKFFCSQ